MKSILGFTTYGLSPFWLKDIFVVMWMVMMAVGLPLLHLLVNEI